MVGKGLVRFQILLEGSILRGGGKSAERDAIANGTTDSRSEGVSQNKGHCRINRKQREAKFGGQ